MTRCNILRFFCPYSKRQPKMRTTPGKNPWTLFFSQRQGDCPLEPPPGAASPGTPAEAGCPPPRNPWRGSYSISFETSADEDVAADADHRHSSARRSHCQHTHMPGSSPLGSYTRGLMTFGYIGPVVARGGRLCGAWAGV
jgi:hypothetical protein